METQSILAILVIVALLTLLIKMYVVTKRQIDFLNRAPPIIEIYRETRHHLTRTHCPKPLQFHSDYPDNPNHTFETSNMHIDVWINEKTTTYVITDNTSELGWTILFENNTLLYAHIAGKKGVHFTPKDLTIEDIVSLTDFHNLIQKKLPH